jgi:hypothetical protein
MKNEKEQPKEELEEGENQNQENALATDQNEKETREDLEKVNNGLEVDEIDRPEE